MLAEANAGAGMNVEETQSWRVAVFWLIFLVLSYLLEKFLHEYHHHLEHKHQRGLIVALEKVKEVRSFPPPQPNGGFIASRSPYNRHTSLTAVGILRLRQGPRAGADGHRLCVPGAARLRAVHRQDVLGLAPADLDGGLFRAVQCGLERFGIAERMV
jgi:hypothetical protein